MIFTSSHPILSDHEIKTIDGLSHVVGDPSELRFRPSSVTIHSWGRFPFSSMERMFKLCDVEILCDESPVFAPGCSLWEMFSGCLNFNQNLPWETSNVADMSFMFYNCLAFNQLLVWDTSNVTDMGYMFAWCGSLTRFPDWNTANAAGVREMFIGCGEPN